jgi:glutaredoxin
MNTFYQLWGVKTPTEAKTKIEEQRAEYTHIENPANLEEQALKLCGKDIYHTLIKGYTEKQWGRSAKELPAFIIKRLPFRFKFDNNYFNDAYQGIPKGGYNPLIEALLKDIEVRLNTNYFDDREKWDKLAESILFTGPIDEFFDYQCGWCKKTNKAIWDEIKDNKAPNIRWIPIDAPIFGEGSALISRYVLAAGKQGKYSEMHHEVAEATGNLDQEALVKLGEKVGLNIDQLKKDAESDEIKAKLEANIAMAREIGVQGVPFMIVNGKPRGGALLGDALAKAVKESNEMK